MTVTGWPRCHHRHRHALDIPQITGSATNLATPDRALPILGIRYSPRPQGNLITSCFPPTSRTWSKRGSTPVIRVRGRSQRRFSVAALCCYKPGTRSRLVYRPKRHTDHQGGGRKSFAWTEYRALLIAAHQQPDGPILLIWDNLNVHKDRRMQAFIDAQDWISAYHLPPYAPDLNPVEGIWSILRRTTQANTAFTDPDHLKRRLRHGLRHIQHRSDIIDGCLTGTGLTLTTPRLQGQ